MRKALYFMTVAALVSAACSKTSVDVAPTPQPARNVISIPLQVESSDIDSDTKSYLSQDGSNWRFVWEDEDQLGYFQYRYGDLIGGGMATVDKRPSSVNVNFTTSNLRAGDALFTYFHQPACDAELDEQGLGANSNPRALYAFIPTVQETNDDPEFYRYSDDFSFTITDFSFDKNSYKKSGTNRAEGMTPQARTLYFKVNGYNPSLKYHAAGAASNLKIDIFGNASVTVNFAKYTSAHKLSTYSYSETVDVKVYVEGHEDRAASVPVTAKASITGNILPFLASVTISYSTGTPSGASLAMDYFSLGDVKPYPVRNCMPLVSTQHSLTATEIEYPEDIAGAMTMYMLGSVIEFKLYSTNASKAVGETLVAAQFITNESECAGLGTCDLVAGDFALSNLTDNTVTSIDYCGKTVALGKDNYQSLYMVIAPGTYSGTAVFITDQNVYIFNVGSKVYTRAVKKALTVDLASSSATVISLEDYYAAMYPVDEE